MDALEAGVGSSSFLGNSSGKASKQMAHLRRSSAAAFDVVEEVSRRSAVALSPMPPDTEERLGPFEMVDLVDGDERRFIKKIDLR